MNQKHFLNDVNEHIDLVITKLSIFLAQTPAKSHSEAIALIAALFVFYALSPEQMDPLVRAFAQPVFSFLIEQPDLHEKAYAARALVTIATVLLVYAPKQSAVWERNLQI